jgi:phosphopantetheinyl transferase (holo-ACP synthase)
LHEADGNPYINVNEQLQAILDEAGITKLHISITTEKDYAAAFVIAVDD